MKLIQTIQTYLTEDSDSLTFELEIRTVQTYRLPEISEH